MPRIAMLCLLLCLMPLGWAQEELPACSESELRRSHEAFMPTFSGLLRGEQDTVAELAQFNAASLQFRSEQLTQLPVCAEAWALSWQLARYLDEQVLHSAGQLAGAGSLAADGALDRMSAARLLDSLAQRLERADAAAAPAASQPPVCDEVQLLRLQLYLIPAYDRLLAATFAAKSAGDAQQLRRQLLELQEWLWRDLPRCIPALELGVVMRRSAADAVNMLWMELAGLPAADIPQLQQLARDLRWVTAQRNALPVQLEAVDRSAPPVGYFVAAAGGANIRSCASTDCAIMLTAASGQALTVLEASGDWYTLQLADGNVGYIAEFLVRTG